jgi:hypothetical protein
LIFDHYGLIDGQQNARADEDLAALGFIAPRIPVPSNNL